MSLICQLTSEDIKHHFIIIIFVCFFVCLVWWTSPQYELLVLSARLIRTLFKIVLSACNWELDLCVYVKSTSFSSPLLYNIVLSFPLLCSFIVSFLFLYYPLLSTSMLFYRLLSISIGYYFFFCGLLVVRNPSMLYYPVLSLLYYSFPFLDCTTRLSIPLPDYAILSFPFLDYTILSFPLLCYTILSFPLLYCTILSFPLLYCTILSFPLLCYIILSFPLLYCTILSFLRLCYTTLSFPLLCYTTLSFPLLCYIPKQYPLHYSSSSILLFHLTPITAVPTYEANHASTWRSQW